MYIEHFLLTEVNETNSYLVGCLQTRQAALIDAGGFDTRIVNTARREGLNVTWILITHDHYDHTGGLAEYRDEFPDARIVAGCKKPGGVKAQKADDGHTLQVGSLAVRTLAIPGHTPDCVAYYFTRETPPAVSALFAGDILFAGSVGGASGANHDSEIRGIREKILTLPESTPIYTGHGPGTTVGIEKGHNPFLT